MELLFQPFNIGLRHLTDLGFFLDASTWTGLIWEFVLDAGEVHLYPVSVKTQGGEKLDLQVSYLY